MAQRRFVEVRDRLVERMIGHARTDSACASAALLGSAARGDQDEWSDIDLAVRLVRGADLEREADRWATWLAENTEVVDYLDVWAWGALYRVFLCADGLQVDLSLWPWNRFRAVNGEPFHLLFGDALLPELPEQRPWPEDARMAWLYALHARAALQRVRALPTDLMLNHWRDRIVRLACVRYGLDPRHGRDAHLLPDDLQTDVARARPATLSIEELRRALVATTDLYLDELGRHDHAYANRLRNALTGPLID